MGGWKNLSENVMCCSCDFKKNLGVYVNDLIKCSYWSVVLCVFFPSKFANPYWPEAPSVLEIFMARTGSYGCSSWLLWKLCVMIVVEMFDQPFGVANFKVVIFFKCYKCQNFTLWYPPWALPLDHISRLQHLIEFFFLILSSSWLQLDHENTTIFDSCRVQGI